MKQLVYFSHATRPLAVSDLKAILDKAREFNGTHAITGLLLYQAGYFLQVLEGDADAVLPLFAKIEGDARHEKVTVLYDQAVEERSFAAWSMGFHIVTGPELEACQGYSDVLSEKVATTEIDLANEMTFCVVSLFKQYVRAAQNRPESP